MCPPSINVVFAGSQPIDKTYIERGTISRAFNVRYLRSGIWHHFVYQATDSTSCYVDYIAKLGLAREDLIRSYAEYSNGEIDLESLIGLTDFDFESVTHVNPGLQEWGVITSVVQYMRFGVKHWFRFDDDFDSPRLSDYATSIGVNLSDKRTVHVEVITKPEQRFIARV